MDYLDFEICIGPGEGRVYPVHVVRSPAGEKRATMTFPFDELALKSHIQALQIALLKSASARRDMVRPQEQLTVKEFGQTLFEAVLPDEVRSSYRLSREKARESGKGLRLRLRIEAPDLAALPWEFLYDDNEGDFVCLSNETPIVRYLELDRPPEPVAIEPPLRILGMVAAPSDRAQLNVAHERQRMSEAIAGLESSGRVRLTWLEGQTWQDLQRAMRQGPWHAFHFVGHGGFDAESGEGMLALATEDGSTYRLPATKLGQLLADHRSLRLAVLNACQGAQASADDIFSSTASVLIRRGIPAVVAMQYEITDRAAIEFSRGFYESIAEGLPVDAAVSEARKAVNLSMVYTVEWGTPVLHMRAPDGRLFDIDALPVGRPAEPAAAPPEPVVEVAVPVEPVASEAGPPQTGAPAPARSAAAPSSSTGIDPKVLKWSALSAGAALVLAVLAFFLFTEPAPPAGADVIEGTLAGGVEGVDVPLPRIGRVLLVPSSDTLRAGQTLRIGVSLLDSLGDGMNERDEAPDVLAWTAEPDGIVTITPDAEGLGAVVRGEAPGTVVVTATAASDGAANRPADTKRITVLPDAAQLSAVIGRYLEAERRFNDPTVRNADVVAAYDALGPADRAALVDAGQIDAPAAIDSVQTSLNGLAALFAGTLALDAADTLTVAQKRAAWQTYLGRADSVRSSPSTTRAVAVLDSLREITQTSASLVSLYTCATGALDCPPASQTDRFDAGQPVYFSAKLKLPVPERVRWAWHGPDGALLREGSDAFPAASGYRTYRNLRDTDAPGRYDLRVFSDAGHLIGRRVFVVE